MSIPTEESLFAVRLSWPRRTRRGRVLRSDVTLRAAGHVDLQATEDEAWSLLIDPNLEFWLGTDLRRTGCLLGAPGERHWVQYYLAESRSGLRASVAAATVVRERREVRWESLSSDFPHGWGVALAGGSTGKSCRVEHAYWMTVPAGFPVPFVEQSQRSLDRAATKFGTALPAALAARPAIGSGA